MWSGVAARVVCKWHNPPVPFPLMPSNRGVDRYWTPYVSGRHTYPIKLLYPTVMYVDRSHIRYDPYRDGRWNPRFVGVTAVLVRGLGDVSSLLLEEVFN